MVEELINRWWMGGLGGTRMQALRTWGLRDYGGREGGGDGEVI